MGGARAINRNIWAFYYTEELMQKQNHMKSYNKYPNDYSEQSGTRLKCGGLTIDMVFLAA